MSSRIATVYSNFNSYNLPVFKLEPKTINSKLCTNVVLDQCEISNNLCNISFTNNCLRWIRWVQDSKPYFSKNEPAIELHLCSLYLPPGRYNSTQDIVNTMNEEMKKAIAAIFKTYTVERPKYLVSKYSGVLEDTIVPISNASFSSLECARHSLDISLMIYENYPKDHAMSTMRSITDSSLTRQAYQWKQIDLYNYIRFSCPDIHQDVESVRNYYEKMKDFETFVESYLNNVHSDSSNSSNSNTEYISTSTLYNQLMNDLYGSLPKVGSTTNPFYRQYIYKQYPSDKVNPYGLNDAMFSIYENMTNLLDQQIDDSQFTSLATNPAYYELFQGVAISEGILPDTTSLVYKNTDYDYSNLNEILIFQNSYTNIGLALASFIVDIFVYAEDTKLYVRSKYNRSIARDLTKEEFSTFPEVKAITTATTMIGFYEINLDTLWSICRSNFFIEQSETLLYTEYLPFLIRIAKSWINRFVNSLALKIRDLNRNDRLKEINTTISLLYETLSGLYEQIKTLDLDELNSDSESDSDFVNFDHFSTLPRWSGWNKSEADLNNLNTLKTEITRLGNELEYYSSLTNESDASDASNVSDLPSYYRSILNIFGTEEFKISQSTYLSCLNAAKLTFLADPCYYYKYGSLYYIVVIRNPDTINATNIGSLILNNQHLNGEISLVLDNDIYTIESGKAGEWNESWNENQIKSFTAIQPIESSFRPTSEGGDLLIYTYDPETKNISRFEGVIPAGTILTRLDFLPLISDAFNDYNNYICQHLYLQRGVFEPYTATIPAAAIPSSKIQGFSMEIIEREGNIASTVTTNKDLLNDPYFSDLLENEGKMWTYYDGDIISKFGIVPVSLREDYIPKVSSYEKIIGKFKTSAVYTKGIVEYNGSTYTKSTNLYLTTRYAKDDAVIDNTRFMYRRSANDVWKSIGATSHLIDLPTAQTYFVKTYNYSEEGFDQSIELAATVSVNGKGLVLSKGLSISSLTYQALINNLLNNVVSISAAEALIVPAMIKFSATINEDVERIVNEKSDTSGSRGADDAATFRVDVDKGQLIMNFSSDVRLSIPQNGAMYVYMTTNEQPYALMNGNYSLRYVYVD